MGALLVNMRPGYASRFRGEPDPLEVSCSEEAAFPHLDELWHYDCVVSPRSAALSSRLHAPTFRTGQFKSRSPLLRSGLVSPTSPVCPSSPATGAAHREDVFAVHTVSPCSKDATHAFSTCHTVLMDARMASHQHRGNLQSVFRTFDEDGDGCVSVDELSAIFEKLGIPKSQESIESLRESSPRRHICSHIDQEEFFMLYDSICEYVDGDGDWDLRAAFHVFDLDGNGLISPEELQKVLCALGFVQGRQLEACVDMISRVDENGDGHVDYAEFKKLMGLAIPPLILSC